MKHEMPPLDLSKLRSGTRDFLLAKSAAEGKSPVEVYIELMDERATKSGFNPKEADHKEAA